MCRVSSNWRNREVLGVNQEPVGSMCERKDEEKLQAESSEEPYLRQREIKGVSGKMGPTERKTSNKTWWQFSLRRKTRTSERD